MSTATEQQAYVEISKSPHARIRIERREFKGIEFIDIRQYYRDDTDTWKPTAKGVTLSPELVGELIKALTPFVGVVA